MLFLLWQLISVLSSLTTEDVIFFSLILFRYLRTVVHFITGVFLYRLALVNDKPRYLSHNAAIIIPTVDPNTNEFLRCCDTVLANGPGVLVVVTVGIKLEQDVRKLIKDHDYESRFPVVKFFVTYTDEANKRRQVARGSDFLDADETPVTICVDDHVYWGPQFLRTLMPAFDDPKVGLVGTNKKVIRDTHGGLWHSFTNFIACLYLVRHNFQIRSEPYVDGGIFVVSGRTSAIRTEILQTEYCKNGYQNEMYLFGLLGPLNPDDDNCITRWVLRNGWKVRIQYSEECKIVTPLGEPHKFYGQVLR